jgi:hypothetical protein
MLWDFVRESGFTYAVLRDEIPLENLGQTLKSIETWMDDNAPDTELLFYPDVSLVFADDVLAIQFKLEFCTE